MIAPSDLRNVTGRDHDPHFPVLGHPAKVEAQKFSREFTLIYKDWC